MDAVLRERTPDGVEWIGLVGCGASKDFCTVQAQELYTGALFQKSRAWCEANMSRWFILSAKHGLIHPEYLVAPYDHALPRGESSKARLDRQQWADRVRWQLIERFVIRDPRKHQSVIERDGGFSTPAFVILAGRAYVQELRANLQCWPVYEPLEGLGIGKRLKWINDHEHWIDDLYACPGPDRDDKPLYVGLEGRQG